MIRHHALFLPLILFAFGCGSSEGAEDLVVGPRDARADVSDTDMRAETARDAFDLARVDATTIPDEVGNAGVLAHQEGDDLVLENGVLMLVYDLEKGTYHMRQGLERLRMVEVDSRVVLEDPITGKQTTLSATQTPFAGWQGEITNDALGQGVAVTVTRKSADGYEIEQRLELKDAESFLLVSSELRVQADSGLAGLKMAEMYPLLLEYETGGALFVGADPVKHLVVDNGSDMYFDFAARVFRVGKGGSVFFPQKGSVANWNMGLYDSESGDSVVAGYFTHELGMGLIALNHDSKDCVEIDGRKGFTRFEAFTNYEPPRPLDPAGTGGELKSELFYLDLAPPTPFDGLERFADRFIKRIGKKLWTDIPTGWNSWGGGSSAQGMSSNISEEIILPNLELMVEDFQPWGMKWFFIDDGWQQEHGDWFTHPERFPDHDGMEGMAWLAKEIKDQGLTPGIWIAPFWAKKNSKIAQEHPDWWADIAELGNLVIGDDDLVPDLTNPEVLQWVHDTFHRITQEWGFKWIKMDFSYFALFATNLSDPDVTASEAYRNALKVIRQAIGPETFFLTVSAMGLCFDLGNGSRTTLDNQPIWGDDVDQGIKIGLRTAAHRYYLNWLWANHHDLLFYRDVLGLTLNEARAWTSAVALMGGIVKLGETYVDMHANPEWLSLVRPLLPVYPVSARPLDMFELLYPEVWFLPVHRDDRAWHVLGLFNWGKNEVLLTGQELEETTKVKSRTLKSLGLDEQAEYLVMDVWTHDCHWETGGTIAMDLEPRTEKVLILRSRPEEPEIAATSRHLLGGAVEVTSEQVQDVDGLLTLSAIIDQPSGYPLEIFVADAGFQIAEVVSPAEVGILPGPCEDVQVISVTPDVTPVSLDIRFEQ